MFHAQRPDLAAAPPPPDNKVPPYWIQQSEMLQGVIDRIASNSLEVKKFGATVWTAIVGFGVTTTTNNGFLGLALAAVLVFGVLDFYYLFLERKFRDNFNRLVRLINGHSTEKDQEWAIANQGNFLSLAGSARFLPRLPSTLASWANLPYLTRLAVTLALFFVDFAAGSSTSDVLG